MLMIILGGVFMIAFVIFIHELGHLLFGRLVGIKAQIFSIGYGKGIWKKQIGDTTWQITAIPLGGYVRFFGDDFSSPGKQKGDFFSVPPLKRMIPVLGGPFFNLLLGLVIYLILHSIYGPLKPEVAFWEEIRSESPAFRDGLMEGDVIHRIDGQNVEDFYDVKKVVSLAGGEAVTFEVLRGDKAMSVEVKPLVDQSGISYVGLRPPGRRFIEVDYPTDELWAYRFRTIFGQTSPPSALRAMPYLNSGDVILDVEGEQPNSVTELQGILGRHHGETVKVRVRRDSIPWLAPWFKEEVEVEVPTSAEFRVELKDIVDLKYNAEVPDQQFISSYDRHVRALAIMKFDGKPAGSYEKIYDIFSDPETAKLSLDGREYRASVHAKRIGLMGFRARDSITPEYLDRHETVIGVLESAFSDTYESIMLYPSFFSRLFSGRMSLVENARGPIGMFAMAGIVFRAGLYDYLQLFAAISFALFVMNLLPFPVLDGGHIMFFLYEAVAGKPLSPAVLERVYRFSIFILLAFGLFVMYRDILFFLTL